MTETREGAFDFELRTQRSHDRGSVWSVSARIVARSTNGTAEDSSVILIAEEPEEEAGKGIAGFRAYPQANGEGLAESR